MIEPGAGWTSRVPKDITTAVWAELVMGTSDRISYGWERDAACADDPRFYDADDAADLAELRQVCSECTVAASCLRDALETEESSYIKAIGVRGGLSSRERNRLRKLRRQARGKRPPVLVPGEPPALSSSSRAEFVEAVARLVDAGSSYGEALKSCGYTGREGQFYRRLWRAKRLDLYQSLRSQESASHQGAA